MKIEVLENSKIKVTLTVEDLIYHNLKPEKLSAQSPGLHKFLFSIMENVRRETGFNPYKGTVAIEAVQSKEGMVLYISGIKNHDNDNKCVTIRGEERKIRVYTKKNVTPENRYYFNDFSNLCKAVVHLDKKALEVSSVYEYEKQWYFILGASEVFEHSHCILSEYCDNFGSVVATESFLSEHGKVVARKEKLITLAEGLKKLEE